MRTEEQDDLAKAVHALLKKESDSESVRAAIQSDAGYDTALWDKLCTQIGVAELEVPEAAVVLEELGYALTPSPMLASVVASEALRETGDTELLDRIASGEVATLVTPDGHNVLHGDQAAILLAMIDGKVSVVQATAIHTPSLDPTLRLADVDTTGQIEGRARTALLVGIAALAVGTAQRGLDMTVAYTKERVQFGRKIGSFQALKHRMADMLVLVETARSAAWAAAAGELDPTTAAAYCIDALQKVAAETIQLHGGIGITWEHDAHLVFKRAHALGQLAGQPHQLRAELLEAEELADH